MTCFVYRLYNIRYLTFSLDSYFFAKTNFGDLQKSAKFAKMIDIPSEKLIRYKNLLK